MKKLLVFQIIGGDENQYKQNYYQSKSFEKIKKDKKSTIMPTRGFDFRLLLVLIKRSLYNICFDTGCFFFAHLFKMQYLCQFLTDFYSKKCFGKMKVVSIIIYRETIEVNDRFICIFPTRYILEV